MLDHAPATPQSKLSLKQKRLARSIKRKVYRGIKQGHSQVEVGFNARIGDVDPTVYQAVNEELRKRLGHDALFTVTSYDRPTYNGKSLRAQRVGLHEKDNNGDVHPVVPKERKKRRILGIAGHNAYNLLSATPGAAPLAIAGQNAERLASRLREVLPSPDDPPTVDYVSWEIPDAKSNKPDDPNK